MATNKEVKQINDEILREMVRDVLKEGVEEGWLKNAAIAGALGGSMALSGWADKQLEEPEPLNQHNIELMDKYGAPQEDYDEFSYGEDLPDDWYESHREM